MPFKTVAELEAHLATRSYVTGFTFSKDDVAAFEALSGFPNASSFPHSARWAKHIAFLAPNAAFGGSVNVAAAAAPAAAPAAGDDMDDLFGDDGELDENGETAAEREANRARRERMEAARKLKEEKDAKEGKKKKEKEAERSLVVLEVKPWEADTDLKMVWEKIIEYKQDGLQWGATFKLEPVAYGIMKLVLTCTIEDAKVLLDDITENIEAIEEYVQSVNVASMNKI